MVKVVHFKILLLTFQKTKFYISYCTTDVIFGMQLFRCNEGKWRGAGVICHMPFFKLHF